MDTAPGGWVRANEDTLQQLFSVEKSRNKRKRKIACCLAIISIAVILLYAQIWVEHQIRDIYPLRSSFEDLQGLYEQQLLQADSSTYQLTYGNSSQWRDINPEIYIYDNTVPADPQELAILEDLYAERDAFLADYARARDADHPPLTTFDIQTIILHSVRSPDTFEEYREPYLQLCEQIYQQEGVILHAKRDALRARQWPQAMPNLLLGMGVVTGVFALYLYSIHNQMRQITTADVYVCMARCIQKERVSIWRRSYYHSRTYVTLKTTNGQVFEQIRISHYLYNQVYPDAPLMLASLTPNDHTLYSIYPDLMI